MDLRLIGNISLSIKRAKISSSNCIHPQCLERTSLRRIPIETRFNLMKKIRFYVAPTCLVCDSHRHSNVWLADVVNESDFPFSCNQIEDMVDLLRLEPKRLNFELPGLCILDLLQNNYVQILKYT